MLFGRTYLALDCERGLLLPKRGTAQDRRRWLWRTLASAVVAASVVTLVTAIGVPSALAYTSVPVTSGDSWSVNDAAAPGIDTGSIRNTATNALMGYGGIHMDVAKSRNPLNGILLRGFGVKYDGHNAFSSGQQRRQSVDVAFGGQLGDHTGSNQSANAATSTGDQEISKAEAWAEWYTPTAGSGSASFNGPSATTIGAPGYARA
ncbi:hypothetical protein ACFU76_16105 [Streptomyces sp. NPDC057539]|uniref:hypothetical protein n=1 Tax=Streptomyces sp. NPDC057539 TaxID=3346159 RepID=UPI00367626B7